MKQIIISGIIFIIVVVASYGYFKETTPKTVYYDVQEDEETMEIANFDKSSLNNYVRSLMEYAYFEGQKDMINGEIKVEETIDGDFIWVESPWDSGEAPIYQPKTDKIEDYE